MSALRSNAIIGLFLFLTFNSFCQNKDNLSFFTPAEKLDNKRLQVVVGTAAFSYTGLSIALYHAWYRKYPSSSFHFFNDWGEWNNVDKAGHIFSSHMQASLLYKSAKWTGLNESKSILWASVLSGVSMTTVELMDAFSNQWGFSVYDSGANLMGIGLFVTQQIAWREQRIVMKVSGWPNDYNGMYSKSQINSISKLDFVARNENLYGSHLAEQVLKDYNSQTIWLSANLKSFFPQSPFPSWLNIAAGYGAENMLGGYYNKWSTSDQQITINPEVFPRYQQYYLALDVDFSRIKTQSPFLKTVLSVLNVLKAPTPAIELNSLGEVQFHLIFL